MLRLRRPLPPGGAVLLDGMTYVLGPAGVKSTFVARAAAFVDLTAGRARRPPLVAGSARGPPSSPAPDRWWRGAAGRSPPRHGRDPRRCGSRDRWRSGPRGVLRLP